MSVIIPPGFAAASMEHWLGNYPRPAVTTWGLDISGASYSPDELAFQFASAFNATISLLLDSSTTMRDARVLIGQDGGDPVVGYSYLQQQGGRNMPGTPPALALMVDKRTNLGGRRNRGRVYLPWAINETEVSEQGGISGARIDLWQATMTSFMGELEDRDIPPVVLHGPGTTTPPPPTPVTNFIPNPTIRTQRRRQTRF